MKRGTAVRIKNNVPSHQIGLFSVLSFDPKSVIQLEKVIPLYGRFVNFCISYKKRDSCEYKIHIVLRVLWIA